MKKVQKLMPFNSKRYYVYNLIDPKNKKIRYIGISNDPLNRLNSHLIENYNKRKREWIRCLKKQGLKPNLLILSYGTYKEALKEEKKLIKIGKKNPYLLNITHKKKKRKTKEITIVLNDKIETKLRKKLGQKGFKKGDLSRHIEDLIRQDLKNKKEVSKK